MRLTFWKYRARLAIFTIVKRNANALRQKRIGINTEMRLFSSQQSSALALQSAELERTVFNTLLILSSRIKEIFKHASQNWG
jgi:hypothetical protein